MEHIVENKILSQKEIFHSQTQGAQTSFIRKRISCSVPKVLLNLEQMIGKKKSPETLTNSLGSSCFIGELREKEVQFDLTHIHLTSMVHFCSASQSTTQSSS